MKKGLVVVVVGVGGVAEPGAGGERIGRGGVGGRVSRNAFSRRKASLSRWVVVLAVVVLQ